MSGLEVTLEATAPIALSARFAVGPGELLAIVGPSGAGKTTLLRAIAGLWRPEAGRIRADGQTWLDTAQGLDLPTHKRRLGFVFQQPALFGHMDAAQNVLAAMPRPDRARAEELLRLLHLEGLGGRRPAELSGGQQQRVALARALAREPAVLLLDEPFSAVDRATRERLHGELIALRRHLPMPVVMVTHDLGEAQLLADRMLVLDEGRVLREGTAAEVMADAEAMRRLGLRELAALLPVVVEDEEEDGLTRLASAGGPVFLPRCEAPVGSRLKLRVMAHEVILARARPQEISVQNVLEGRVARLVPGRGPGLIVHVAIGEDEILARITARAQAQLQLAPGEPVFALIKSMAVARDQVVRAAGEAGAPGA